MRRLITVLTCAIAVAGVLGFPACAQARGTVAILMPGGSGAADAKDFLIRNRNRFISAGIRAVVASTPDEAVSISKSERAARVIIVAMSRGVIRAAIAFAHGAHASRAVFVSGNYNRVMSILGTPARLPSTLVVQNRYDRCPGTTPTHVEPFRRWAMGKVSVHWANFNGPPARNACTPFAAHGFYGHDAAEIAAILAFIR
jgi:hypothetical protein